MEWCGTMWPKLISMNDSLFSTPVYSTDWKLDTLLHVFFQELKTHNPSPSIAASSESMFRSIAVLRYLLYGFQLASQVLVSSDLAKNTPKRARWTAIRGHTYGYSGGLCYGLRLVDWTRVYCRCVTSPSKRGGGVTSQKIHWITLW